MARKHRSQILEKILDRITPLKSMQVVTKMDLAARIDDLIIRRGWSKSEFAEKVNKNPSEISRWLSGKHNFTLDTLCEIAIAFDLNIKDLFSEAKYNVIIAHAEVKSISEPSPYLSHEYYKTREVAEPITYYAQINSVISKSSYLS